MTYRVKYLFSISIISLMVLNCRLPASAQNSSAPNFEKAVQYAAIFSGLNEKIESNHSELDLQGKQIASLMRNLQETEADLRGIEGIAFEVKVKQQSAIATADSNNLDLNRILSEGAGTPLGKRLATAPGTSILTGIATLASQAKAEAYNLEQVRSQLSIAQRATVERRLKILSQLQDLSRQAESRLASQKQLINDYIDHADTAGKRSRLELRAALRALESADSDNVAAALARGITLLRLEQLPAAESALDDLVMLPEPISTVALAARAELYSRLNKDKKARADMGSTLNSQIPSVVLLRARAWAIMGMNIDAIKSWEQLSKFKTHQHIAWSSLALHQCSGSTNSNLARKSLEQTQLADELCNGTDWYYKLALAFAQAANKDLPKAAETANQAAGLTTGDKRQLCLEIAQQLEAGQIAKWKW